MVFSHSTIWLVTNKFLRFSIILFDWGDTVMRDHPEVTMPMVEWETLEVIDGIAEVLEYLHASGRRIILATSASISDESQIWGALKRVGLDRYFSKIYCFKNTGLPKGEAFYRHILDDLNVPASEVMMVGDTFEKDVRIPNELGIFAVWFNPKSEERQEGDLHVTVSVVRDLLGLFSAGT